MHSLCERLVIGSWRMLSNYERNVLPHANTCFNVSLSNIGIFMQLRLLAAH